MRRGKGGWGGVIGGFSGLACLRFHEFFYHIILGLVANYLNYLVLIIIKTIFIPS